MSGDKKPILIADPDLEFLETLKKDPQWNKVKIIFCDNGAQAQKEIKENKGTFAAVLISLDLKKPDGASVIKFSLMYQPTVPVHLIESLRSENNAEYTPEELGVSGALPKPFNIDLLISKLGSSLDIFDLSAALKLGAANKDKLDQELEDTDPNFRPIKAELFISGSKSLFDVYVKLRSNKYIKILQSGDVFDVERVLEYLRKGVEHFFIRKEALESYVTYCDRLTQAITKSKTIDTQKKFSFVFNQAEVTLNSIVDMGVDSDSIVYAQKYLKNVCQVVNGLSKESSFLSSMMREMGQFDHSGAVVMISSIVAKEAGVETDKGIQALGLASFLHDIGFVEEPDAEDLYSDGKTKVLDESEVKIKMDSKNVYGDELALYRRLWKNHAELGARMIENEKSIPVLVSQIIRQHHSQRDKREGTFKGGAVHFMAEILELADDFVRLHKQFNEGDGANKQDFLAHLMKTLSLYPTRTREPFMAAFKLLPKA